MLQTRRGRTDRTHLQYTNKLKKCIKLIEGVEVKHFLSKFWKLKLLIPNFFNLSLLSKNDKLTHSLINFCQKQLSCQLQSSQSQSQTTLVTTNEKMIITLSRKKGERYGELWGREAVTCSPLFLALDSVLWTRTRLWWG